MCLQETKLEWITRGIVRSIWSCPYVDWLYLGSDGASGGILLMRDSRVVEKVEEAMGHFSVSCKFKNVGEQFGWAFTVLPWSLGGDFNIICFPSERLGAASFSRAMYGFFDFVSLHGFDGYSYGKGPLYLVQYFLRFSARPIPFLTIFYMILVMGLE